MNTLMTSNNASTNSALRNVWDFTQIFSHLTGLTPLCILPWKGDSYWTGEEISCLFGNLKVIIEPTKFHNWTLFWASTTQSKPCSSKVHFVIAIPGIRAGRSGF